GKNMVGAFHQPRLVLADVGTLRSLPPREIAAGLAEMLKHGAIADPAYLESLERDMGRLAACDTAAMAAAVARSCEIKSEGGAAGNPQLRPYLRPCGRGRARLRAVAAWGGGGHRHGDGRRALDPARHAQGARARPAGRGDRHRGLAGRRPRLAGGALPRAHA